MLVHVDDDNACSTQPGEFDDGQSDRPGAEHDPSPALDQTSPMNGMQADREGLGQGRRHEWRVSRHLDALGGYRIEIGREAALHVGLLRGRTHEIDVLAEVRAPLPASGTVPAPARRIHRDAIADLQA